ncbi:MAG: GTP 3',8-cyclase MoaA [Candidatus Binatia bacterium]
MAPPHDVQTSDRLGRPLRDLRISVTDRCNFRCPYCMPAEIFGEKYAFLPRPELLTFEEIARIARLSVELGATKLRITGGEPLLRRDLSRLVEQLASIEGLQDLALTTNGTLLAEQAAALADAGLRRVTVSLDSLDDEAFKKLNGREHSVAPVLEGIEAAERAGLDPIKINCVVVRGVNDHGVVDLARRFKGTGHTVRFIEYMDVGTRNAWVPDEVVSAAEIVEQISASLPIEPVDPAYRGEVARRYRYRDGGGEVGVVSSISAPFCGDCTRARLSSDGRLLTCLFATTGRDLKTPLRDGTDDDTLRGLIGGVWRARTDRYSEERSARARPADPDTDKIEMYEIGG